MWILYWLLGEPFHIDHTVTCHTVVFTAAVVCIDTAICIYVYFWLDIAEDQMSCNNTSVQHPAIKWPAHYLLLYSFNYVITVCGSATCNRGGMQFILQNSKQVTLVTLKYCTVLLPFVMSASMATLLPPTCHAVVPPATDIYLTGQNRGVNVIEQ